MPSVRCTDVLSCVRLSGVADATIMMSKGVVPWRYIAGRVVWSNPELNPVSRRTSEGTGGLAQTPLREMNQTHVDLRDPWSSVFALIYRLRDIARRRLPQFAGLWSGVFGDSPKQPFIYAPVESLGAIVLTNSIVVLSQVAGIRLLARGLQSASEPRTICGAAEEFPLSSLPWCVVGDESWTHLLSGGLFGEHPKVYAVHEVSEPSALYGTENKWPNQLLRDPGFWTLVFFEEAAGQERADALWAVIEQGGLRKLLGGPSTALADVFATVLVHAGDLYTRDLYYRAAEILDSESVPGQSNAVLREYLEMARRIVRDADPGGAARGLAGPTADDVHGDPTVSLSYGDFYDVLVPWSQEARIWAGETYVAPNPNLELPPGNPDGLDPSKPKEPFDWSKPVVGLMAAGLLFYIFYQSRQGG